MAIRFYEATGTIPEGDSAVADAEPAVDSDA